MKYMVKYRIYGEDDLNEFDDLDTALSFMNENINDVNYGDFRLFSEIQLDVSVTVAVD